MNSNYSLLGSQVICYNQIEHRVQFGYHGIRSLNEGHVQTMRLGRYEGTVVWVSAVVQLVSAVKKKDGSKS
jgi:hypothetical protein